MNVKLHTPKSLKAGSGMSSMKQFLLSLLATTVSIALTFGTAAVIDHNKQQKAKKEMAKMIIYDFNKTIEEVMKADTAFSEASRLQLELAAHPEYFDSLRFSCIPVIVMCNTVFSETTERIFSTSIETFNTIGDVNFVNEVSEFYLTRSKYQEMVLDSLKNEPTIADAALSLKALFNISFPDYALLNHAFLNDMKASRDNCMQMLRISEKEMEQFSQKRSREKAPTDEEASMNEKLIKEFSDAHDVVAEAREKFKD